MLASITPLGERGRSNRWATTVAAHLLGTVAPAAAQGALLGAVGALLPLGTTARMAATSAAAVAAVALDLRRIRPPGLRRQVAEDWLDRLRGWVYGGGYGAQLGLGWATIVTTWLVWAALAGMLLVGSWRWGLVVGAAFGLGRGLPVLATARVVDGMGLQRLHRRLAGWEAPFRLASLAGGAALALALVVVGVTSELL
jgi:hypothetical protein